MKFDRHNIATWTPDQIGHQIDFVEEEIRRIIGWHRDGGVEGKKRLADLRAEKARLFEALPE